MKKTVVILLCAVLVLTLLPSEVSASAGTMKISSLKVTETGENTYKMNWTILRGSVNMNVRVYLSPSDHDYEVPAAEIGSIRSGSEGSLEVTVSDVDSGYYHFLVTVTTMSGTVAYAFSDEAIFYDNPEGAAALPGITAGRNGNTVYAVWNDETPAILYLYDAKTKELLTSEYGYEKPLSAKIPSGHTDVYAGVAAYDGTGGRFTPVLCPADDLPDTYGIFMEESITNQPELDLSSLSDACRIFLNGSECTVEDGACQILLSEGENNLFAFVTGDTGATAAEPKTLELDTIAPELTIERPGLSVTTQKSRIFIQGYAEEGAFVTCDNDAVAMVSDCFSIEKTVPIGTHKINVTASDKAGNSTIYTIEVRRSLWTGWLTKLILFVILAAAGVGAEAYLLIFRQRRKKSK